MTFRERVSNAVVASTASLDLGKYRLCRRLGLSWIPDRLDRIEISRVANHDRADHSHPEVWRALIRVDARFRDDDADFFIQLSRPSLDSMRCSTFHRGAVVPTIRGNERNDIAWMRSYHRGFKRP